MDRYEKATYTNSKGDVLYFGYMKTLNSKSYMLYLNSNDLHDAEWNTVTINGRISNHYMDISEKKLPIQVWAEDEETGIEVKNMIADVFDYDIITNQHGTFTVNGWSIDCFIKSRSSSNYNINHKHLTLNCTLETDDPFWTKEESTTIKASDATTVQTSSLNIPDDVCFGTTCKEATILNSDDVANDIRIEIDGAVSSPSLVVSAPNAECNVYHVNDNFLAGETMRYDTNKKTITKSTNADSTVPSVDDYGTSVSKSAKLKNLYARTYINGSLGTAAKVDSTSEVNGISKVSTEFSVNNGEWSNVMPTIDEAYGNDVAMRYSVLDGDGNKKTGESVDITDSAISTNATDFDYIPFDVDNAKIYIDGVVNNKVSVSMLRNQYHTRLELMYNNAIIGTANKVLKLEIPVLAVEGYEKIYSVSSTVSTDAIWSYIIDSDYSINGRTDATITHYTKGAKYEFANVSVESGSNVVIEFKFKEGDTALPIDETWSRVYFKNNSVTALKRNDCKFLFAAPVDSTTNKFGKRNRNHPCLEKLPSGLRKLWFNHNKDIKITQIKKRSEPEWH